MDKAKLLQGVNNGKQITILANAMALDQSSTGDPKLGWPGDLALAVDPGAQITSLDSYVQRLMTYDYIKAQDVGKVFGGPGLPVWSGTGTFAYTNSAWKVFKVLGSDGGNTVFLESKNYTFNTPLSGATAPYGDTGFVIARKDSSATSYQKQQAQNVMQIGYLTGTADPSPTNPGVESQANFLQ